MTDYLRSAHVTSHCITFHRVTEPSVPWKALHVLCEVFNALQLHPSLHDNKEETLNISPNWSWTSA